MVLFIYLFTLAHSYSYHKRNIKCAQNTSFKYILAKATLMFQTIIAFNISFTVHSDMSCL